MCYNFLPVEIKEFINYKVYQKAHMMIDINTLLWLSRVNKLCNISLNKYIANALRLIYIHDIHYRIIIYNLKIDNTAVAKIGKYKPGIYCGLYTRTTHLNDKNANIQHKNDKNIRLYRNNEKYISIRHNTDKIGLLIDDRGLITGIDLTRLYSTKIELDV